MNTYASKTDLNSSGKGSEVSLVYAMVPRAGLEPTMIGDIPRKNSPFFWFLDEINMKELTAIYCDPR